MPVSELRGTLPGNVGFANGMLVRVVIAASFGGGPNHMVNVLHYDLQDATVPGTDNNDPQALADAFRDDVIPTVQANFDSGWTIQPVVVQQEKDPLNPDEVRDGWTSGSAVAGTRTGVGDILPIACCPVATLHTGHIGRRARGRIFLLGPLSEADQNAGTIGSSQLVRYQNFLDAIPRQPDIAPGGGVTDAVANWVVYSRRQRGLNKPGYANAVTDVVLQNQVHFLRSRSI